MEDPLRIVHIQGTIIHLHRLSNRSAKQSLKNHSNWELVVQECGDFTRAKAYEVMRTILKQTTDIDVVYCENDGEALGAIAAMEGGGA